MTTAPTTSSPAGPGFALFGTAGGLCAHLRRDDTSHVLSRTPGWAQLQQSLRAGTPDVSEVVDFRLDRLARWSPRGPHAGLTDALNLIWDLAHQMHDPLLAALSERPAPLRHLYDVLNGDARAIATPARTTKAARQAVRRVAALATWDPPRPRRA